MKITLLILSLAVFLSANSSAQSFKIFRGDTINRTDAKGLKQGEWKRFYDNNQLFSITTFKNGKPTGKTLTWYKSGEKQGELIHAKDGKTAYMTSYWPDGKIKATGKYVNQEKDSTWNYYNEKDVLTAVENYKLGKAHGMWKIYYPDGKISEETNFVNGMKHGDFKKYFPNGNQKMAGIYKNDTFEGMVLHFHLNGKPYIKGRFEVGLKEGEWIYMNDSGIKDSSEFYNNGILQEK